MIKELVDQGIDVTILWYNPNIQPKQVRHRQRKDNAGTDSHTDRQTNTQTDKHTDRQTHTLTDKQTGAQTDRQTDTDRQT
jgi:predicted adenine nucleotide alpha hydrolase (AANH) superfamily ATPase